MRRTVSAEMMLVALLVGAALGFLIFRAMKMDYQLAGQSAQLANQDARIAVLETERAEQLKSQARAKGVLGIASRCLKLTWGLIKNI